MWECMHCGHKSVIWDNDFDFEDIGREGSGIVHICHCTHCGADITYEIATSDDEEVDNGR